MDQTLNSGVAGEGLSRFLEKLLTDGQAEVEGGATPPLDEAAIGLLATWERDARLDLAGKPPEYVPAAAGWAAIMVYRACQLVVCRDVTAEEVAAALAEPVPAARCPAVDWSVDLVLRHLPEVFRLARHLSPADPLVRELRRLAAAWPLSSVGIDDLGPLKLESFVRLGALLQLYADRVLAAADVSRLGDPRVDAALAKALGAHPELCPEIARRLLPETSAQSPPQPKL